MHHQNESEDAGLSFRCYGVEKEPDTVKLAKMNLLLNNIRGDITEANSFYSDPYKAFGQFDYVMANPPFNVDEVVVEKVIDDARFNTYGVPRNKSKSTKKNSDKKETVPNANYLWIGYFATALNGKGKAGLVMANSASDSSGSDYEIRKKMIEEGIISQMVTLPSNMFSSVTLPATLWFFDKNKPSTDKKDEIIFIDARNVFTQVDRAHRKFSEEQIKNLGIITRLYEGDAEAMQKLMAEYETRIEVCRQKIAECEVELANRRQALREYKANNKPTAKAYEKTVASLIKYINDEEAVIADYTDSHNPIDEDIKSVRYWQDQIDWLTERFPEGKYCDVIGLCKVAKLDGEDGIIDQDYSLNPGRYVGVVIEDDGMTVAEFTEKMLSLNSKYRELSIKAKSLEDAIDNNLRLLLEGY